MLSDHPGSNSPTLAVPTISSSEHLSVKNEKEFVILLDVDDTIISIRNGRPVYNEELIYLLKEFSARHPRTKIYLFTMYFSYCVWDLAKHKSPLYTAILRSNVYKHLVEAGITIHGLVTPGSPHFDIMGKLGNFGEKIIRFEQEAQRILSLSDMPDIPLTTVTSFGREFPVPTLKITDCEHDLATIAAMEIKAYSDVYLKGSMLRHVIQQIFYTRTPCATSGQVVIFDDRHELSVTAIELMTEFPQIEINHILVTPAPSFSSLADTHVSFPIGNYHTHPLISAILRGYTYVANTSTFCPDTPDTRETSLSDEGAPAKLTRTTKYNANLHEAAHDEPQIRATADEECGNPIAKSKDKTACVEYTNDTTTENKVPPLTVPPLATQLLPSQQHTFPPNIPSLIFQTSLPDPAPPESEYTTEDHIDSTTQNSSNCCNRCFTLLFNAIRTRFLAKLPLATQDRAASTATNYGTGIDDSWLQPTDYPRYKP